MDFEIAHELAAPADDVARALLDEDFQASLRDLGPLADRRVLSQTEGADGTVRRATRCVLGIDLGAARKFLGSAEPAWVEDATWDPKALRWDWVIKPEVGADLLRAAGATTIEADDAGGARRRVAGMVQIRVPLYGARVEGWIVKGLEESYDEEARRLQQWLDRKS